MLIIANNISTRNSQVDQLLRQWQDTGWDPQQPPAAALQGLARRCVAAGADILEINLQQHDDRPGTLASAVKLIQKSTDRQLCLSTNNPEALKAGLKACNHAPLVNYLSIDEVRLREMLPSAAQRGAEVILLVSDPAHPTDAREMLQKAAIIIGAANEMGIPNSHILIDPGIIHIASESGQRHLVEVREFLQSLPEAFDPPVRSAGWIGNVSAGAPEPQRGTIEATALAMLAGLGLSAAFLDILEPHNARTTRLLKVFNNETVYAPGDIEL